MSNSIIKLPCFNITVSIINGGGSISSSLEEPCDCGRADPGWCPRCSYNDAVDGIESLILAHACAGIDITTPAYIEGIETAVQACAENL
jgi:hypothetical protein